MSDSPYWNAERATYEDELNAFVRRTHPDDYDPDAQPIGTAWDTDAHPMSDDRCPVHGTERTAMRGGDPYCSDCYFEETLSMPDYRDRIRNLSFERGGHPFVWTISENGVDLS